MIKYKIEHGSPLEVSDRKILKLYPSDPSSPSFVNQYVIFLGGVNF